MSKNDLIVDFPNLAARLPNVIEANEDEEAKASVHFDRTSTVVFFHTPDDIERSKMWYTAEDYTEMKQAVTRASISARNKLPLSLSRSSSCDSVRSTPSIILEDDNDDECLTGIEHLLSVKLIKKAYARRMQCLNAVLDEQERQRYWGKSNPDLLAQVSQYYSKCSTKRAVIIGTFNAAA